MSFETQKSKRLGIIIGTPLIIGSIYAVFFTDWGKDKAPEPQPVRPLKMIRIGETSLLAVREYPGKVTGFHMGILSLSLQGNSVFAYTKLDSGNHNHSPGGRLFSKSKKA